MTEYLFRLTFENLDDNDCYDIEINISTDDYYYAWCKAAYQAREHVNIRGKDGYSIELVRIEVISMFNPKI